MNKFTLLISCLLFVGLAAFTFQDTNEKIEKGGYIVGDTAEDFLLKNVDETMISMKEKYPNAKGYVVTFTCNHCPYSVLYEDRLIDLHNNFAQRGFPVIAINPNDPAVSPDDAFIFMQERAREKNFPFVYLFDEGQKIYPKYGAARTPHVFLLDKDLKVRYIGAIDNNPSENNELDQKNGGRIQYVVNAIEALENGTKPDPSFTRAIGCTIKGKK